MTKYFRETLKLKNAIVTFNFNDIEILHDSMETKAELSSKLYKLGLLSMNEAREMVELEPLDTEDADKHFLPAYLTGSRPIAIENYTELLDSGFFDESVGNGETDGSGSSGGADNSTTLTTEELGTEPNE